MIFACEGKFGDAQTRVVLQKQRAATRAAHLREGHCATQTSDASRETPQYNIFDEDDDDDKDYDNHSEYYDRWTQTVCGHSTPEPK